MSKLDAYFSGYSTLQWNGASLPQRAILNIIPGTAGASLDDSPATLSTILTLPGTSSGGGGLSYPLINPVVEGTSLWSAQTNGAATYAGTQNIPPTPTQTTPAAHSAVVIATIPLPGTTGAKCSKGMCSVVYDVDVTGTSTTVAAKWAGTIAYTLQTVGTPVLLANAQTTAMGTNSTAVPSAWTLIAQLDGGSANIQLVLTTDSADTYSVNPITQVKYTQ